MARSMLCSTPQHHHRHRGGERNPKLVRPLGENLPHPLHVDQLDPDQKDDRREHGGRQERQRTGEERSTMRTTIPVVSWAVWLVPPVLSTIWVFVGLPLTTKVPERPAARFATPNPTRSVFSSKLSWNLSA